MTGSQIPLVLSLLVHAHALTPVASANDESETESCLLLA